VNLLEPTFDTKEEEEDQAGWSSVSEQQANAVQKPLVGSKSSVETGAKEEMHQRSSAQRTLE
jgi:hypothetical protein